jgi:hypothetical protein
MTPKSNPLSSSYRTLFLLMHTQLSASVAREAFKRAASRRAMIADCKKEEGGGRPVMSCRVNCGSGGQAGGRMGAREDCWNWLTDWLVGWLDD